MAANLLHEQFHRAVTHLDKWNVHAGQRRFLHGALRPVIEADDRNILWNLHAGIAECPVGAEGRFIVARQHSCEGSASADDLSHSGFAGIEGVSPPGHQALVRVQAVQLQRSTVGGQSGAGVARQVSLAAGDESDTPVAMLHEMPKCMKDAARVVGDNGRPELPGTDELHRVTVRAHLLQVARTHL